MHPVLMLFRSLITMSSDMGLHLETAHFGGKVFECREQLGLEARKHGCNQAQLVALVSATHRVNDARLNLRPCSEFFEARR